MFLVLPVAVPGRVLGVAHGINVTVTVDIESQNLAALPAEQVDALRENLNTLGFTDWNIE